MSRAIILALSSCENPIFAKKETPVAPKYVPRRTIEIPHLPRFYITFNNVYGFFSYDYLSSYDTNQRNYRFIVDCDTIQFNCDMTVRLVNSIKDADMSGMDLSVSANTTLSLSKNAIRFYVVDGKFLTEGFIDYIQADSSFKSTTNLSISIENLRCLLRNPDYQMVYREYEEGGAYGIGIKPGRVDNQVSLEEECWGRDSYFQLLTEFNEEMTKMIFEEAFEDMEDEAHRLEHYAEYHPEVLEDYVPKYPEYLEEHYPDFWSLFKEQTYRNNKRDINRYKEYLTSDKSILLSKLTKIE